MVKTSIGGTRIIGRLCAGKVFLFLIYSLGFSRSINTYSTSQLRCLHPIYLIIFLVLINKERNGCINFFILFAISLLDLINLPFYWFAGNKNGLLLPHTTTDQGDSYFFMFVLIFSTYNVIWPCYNDFVTPFLPKQKFTLLTL